MVFIIQNVVLFLDADKVLRISQILIDEVFDVALEYFIVDL